MRKALAIFGFVLCVSAIAETFVNVTASGGGRFVCRVDGIEVSQHTSEYKAAEQAVSLKLSNPDSSVVCDQQKTLVASLTAAGRTLISDSDASVIVVEPTPTGNLTWEKPTTLADGSAIPANTLTGYKIYQKSGGTYSLHSTIGDEDTLSASVPDGQYAVATTWDDGVTESQTALSMSVVLPDPISVAGATQTFTTSDSKATIQAAIDLASPGDLFLFRGGTYRFNWESTHSGAPLDFDVAGTAANPIIFASYPGEWAVFQGWGDQTKWDTSGSNGWDWPDGDSDNGQVLLNIDAAYVHLYNLEATFSARYNIVVNDPDSLMVNVRSTSGWLGNITYGSSLGSGSVANSTLRYVESAYCAHRTGIEITHESSPVVTDASSYDGITFDRTLVYANGRNSDDRNVVDLAPRDGGKPGGNADGLGIFKQLNRNEGGSLLTDSLVSNFKLFRTIAFANADNQMDFAPGSGFQLNQSFAGNIRTETGNQGARGFKFFHAADGPVTLLGSMAFHANIQSATAGDGFFPDLEPAESEFKAIGLGGVDLQTTMLNMDQVDNASPNTSDSVIKNGMHYLTGGFTDADLADYDDSNNFTSGNPDLNDPLFAFGYPDDLDSTGDPRSRFQSYWRHLNEKFMPDLTSSLVDGGVMTGEYSSTAADDPTTPSDPEDIDKLPWFANQTTTTSTVPDQGPVQYQYIFPPEVN